MLNGLLVANITQPSTYLDIVSFIWGKHQNFCNCDTVLPTPKCHEMREVLASFITCTLSLCRI